MPARMMFPTGVARETAVRPATAQPLGNWRVRLANAVAVRGYATVDLRPLERSPFVPLAEALDRAARDYRIVDEAVWPSIAAHLLTLKVFGIETLAVKGHENKLALVALRTSPDGVLDLAEATSYHVVMNQWLETLAGYLPQVKLSSGGQAQVDKAAAWVGRNTGRDAIGWMAAKLMSAFARARKASSCVTVHPIAGPPSAEYSAGWVNADITTEPLFSDGRHVNSANDLWSLRDNTILRGGSGVGEGTYWTFEFTADELTHLVRGVNDQ